MTNRRRFIQVAVGTAGFLTLRAAGMTGTSQADEIAPAGDRLKILFLGGTGFIGPHEINHALARGHDVTMFNRGNRSGLYGTRVEEIIGNRDTNIDEGLEPLAGDRTWDVVVDNSGYVPRHVRDSVELLGDRCRRYVYISTLAVYDNDAGRHFDEDGDLDTMEDPSIEDVTWETYGPLKADCDRLVRDALGSRATVVRPTFIIGPGDRTDRFTYWADRIHRGGDVVGPANPEVAIQFIDVRDLCPWVITLAENDTPGVFNAAGPVWTRKGLLWGVNATHGDEVRFHWPSHELATEMEWPAPMLDWGTESTTFGIAAAKAAGLDTRPLADSTVATLEWWRAQDEERRANPRGWPPAELEKKMLERMEVG